VATIRVERAIEAPPFSGLDTLPALGVAGVVLEIAVGRLAIDALDELL
jgi:hypothetical protein